MAERNRAGMGAGSWENHYSPKYGKCFVSATFAFTGEGAGKTIPLFSNALIDAFERSFLALSAHGGNTEGACYIGEEKPADCAKAEAFISEHMKN